MDLDGRHSVILLPESLRRQRGYINPAILSAIGGRRRSGATVGGGGGGGGGGTDPHFANVIALLHFDGADGATVFSDKAPGSPSNVWTPSGHAQIDTAQSKFGGASLLLDGTDDRLTSQASALFSFGSGSFTMEGWCRASSSQAQATPTIIQNNGTFPTNTWALNLHHASTPNHLSFWVGNWNNAAAVLTGTTELRDNAWHFWTVERSGNNWYLYVDGVLEDFDTNAAALDSGAPAIIVSGAGTNAYTGHQDEIRLTKGVARYAGSPTNFTPPSAAFPDS